MLVVAGFENNTFDQLDSNIINAINEFEYVTVFRITDKNNVRLKL